MRPLLALLSAGCLLAIAERPAWAIAVPANCVAATVVPRAATIPASLPAFAYTATMATNDDIHLTDNTATGAAQTLTLGPVQDGLLKAVPAPGLVEGHNYTLDFQPFCGISITPIQGPLSFVAGPAAALPSAMGGAPTAPVAKIENYGTSAFTLTTTMTLDASMKPWLGVYQVVVILDGNAVNTTSTQPDGDTLSLVATGWCDATLSSNTHHSLAVRGRLPFAPTVDSEAVALDFSCPAPAIGTSGSDPPSPISGPPGSTAGTAPTTSTSQVTSGGCNAGGAPLDVTSALAAVAIVSALVRRRGAAATRRT